VPLTDVTREELRALMARYPVARAALLPMLHLVQSHEGFVSEDGIALCAQMLGLTKAEVGAVATFYTMYKREPVGDYLLSVCTNPTCKIVGGQDIYEGWVEACGGAHTDPERPGVMVEHAECLGICDAAPVVQINYEMYGPVTVEEGLDLLKQAKAGEPPVSNRSGETPGTFREVERQLSGIDDGVHEHLVEAARVQVAGDVPPAYRSGETDIPVTHPGGDPAGHGGQIFAAAAGFGGTPDAARTDAAAEATATRPDVADELTADERAAAAAVRDEVGREGQELADEATVSGPSEPPADAAIGAEGTTDEAASDVDQEAGARTGVPADAPSPASERAGDERRETDEAPDAAGGAPGDAATDPADRVARTGGAGPDEPTPTDEQVDDDQEGGA
jgi:NADH-quinone oxidoreductase subunit E